MHLTGFTIEIYHDARSHERQKYSEVAFYARDAFSNTPHGSTSPRPAIGRGFGRCVVSASQLLTRISGIIKRNIKYFSLFKDYVNGIVNSIIRLNSIFFTIKLVRYNNLPLYI